MRNILLLPVLILTACGCSSPGSRSVQLCTPPAGLPEANVMLLGEMHGSVEAPAIAGDIACALSSSGPVALGLELPLAQQASIDAYLQTAGEAEARAALLSGHFWQRVKDGRSSEATVQLIERVRSLRNQGAPITLFAFDGQEARGNRDRALADEIRKYHHDNPGKRIVALMGNIHAKQDAMVFDGKELVPTGVLLSDLHPVSVLLTYGVGTIWACMPNCGIHAVNSSWAKGRSPGFSTEIPMSGYDQSYLMPIVSASPPAVSAQDG